MKRTVYLAILMGILLLPGVARATSLWQDGSDLYSDHKAQYVGDIVTILVREVITATQKSSTDVNQQEKMEVKDGTGILNTFLNAFGAQGQDQYQTDGTTTSSNNLTTTISAEVVEVMPNGNLVIEARRSMVVNKETQIVVLSGIVRPDDINKSNQVVSTSIANVQLRYEGKGQIARRQKPGILNKLFDWIF